VAGSNGSTALATRGKSVAFMALAMACHYLGMRFVPGYDRNSVRCSRGYSRKLLLNRDFFFNVYFCLLSRKIGYSLARPISIALFTSKATGYPNSPGAFPFAMAFVSPVSLLLLLAYGSILQKRGPRGALERTTLYCSSVILGSSAAIEVAQRTNAVLWNTSIPMVKLISGPLFVFRESYVQLLTRFVKTKKKFQRSNPSCLKKSIACTPLPSNCCHTLTHSFATRFTLLS
jgi:hypothetical protein